MTKPTKKRFKKGCLIPLVLLVLFMTFVVYSLQEVSTRITYKKASSHAYYTQNQFSHFLHEVGPEVQFESDTCGLHTLRVIYKAHGLDPDQENLKVRLGVEVASNPADPESTGTVQPDLMRVLAEDGFDYKPLDLSATDSGDYLVNHLNKGHMAAVLIARRENKNMHWVAAYRMQNGKIEILDSLFEGSYLEVPTVFLNECVLSCILVKPTKDGISEDSINMALWTGAEELIRTMKRYTAITKN